MKNREKKIALRLSEYEGLETLEKMAGKIKWVWIDSFHKFYLTPQIMDLITKWGYKTCLVSPELQKRPEEVITTIKNIKEQNRSESNGHGGGRATNLPKLSLMK